VAAGGSNITFSPKDNHIDPKNHDFGIWSPLEFRVIAGPRQEPNSLLLISVATSLSSSSKDYHLIYQHHSDN
jgi:hypothetical protein